MNTDENIPVPCSVRVRSVTANFLRRSPSEVCRGKDHESSDNTAQGRASAPWEHKGIVKPPWKIAQKSDISSQRPRSHFAKSQRPYWRTRASPQPISARGLMEKRSASSPNVRV